MPRYFFHIRRGNVLVEDSEGIEVSEIEALEEEGIEAARDLLADGDLGGLDRREWAFEIADETGTTVLALPFKEAVEADLPVVAMTQESSPADRPCPRCSGSGTECEAVSALGERTLAALRGSDARFSDHGSRVHMQCTLCSGSGFVTAARADNIAWAKNVMGENSPAGRRKWSRQRRADRAWLLRLVRKPDQQ
jgi:hypothetical protein